MYLVEDVYSQAEIDEAMEETDVKPAELELARQIVQGLASEFDPSELTSAYRRDLRTLLEAKLRGEEIAAPEPVAEPAPAVDLIEALKASVAAAKASSSRPKKAADKPKAEKRPARKAARK
jgi:DNA end-binding protein Ku